MSWAGVDSVAAGLPDGVDALLTRRFDMGVELSGGDWQKVALARPAARDARVEVDLASLGGAGRGALHVSRRPPSTTQPGALAWRVAVRPGTLACFGPTLVVSSSSIISMSTRMPTESSWPAAPLAPRRPAR